VSKDEELLLEAFTMLYQVYREQKAGRKYYRPVSIYPTLAKIQRRLDKPVEQKLRADWRDYTMELYAENVSPAKVRDKANAPWT
jgi:hypothetical protein